ncbi:hypothetical protein F4823DRAFT_561778 [Ustulina deusta]|nr:hypothetical protein F4823DRAFT_561778 [Ustulina deusta]
MEHIKRFFASKKTKGKPKSMKRLEISSPVEASFKKLTPESSSITGYPARLSSRCQYRGDSAPGSAITSFIPRDRGREETISWLNTGTCESLASILTVRDQAAKQIRRAPRTKGTKEVQLILKKPSCKAVEQLHHLQKQTEMAIRYGAPGVVVYNFSKSLGWNQASTSRLPSLQLRDFETRMKELKVAAASIPAVPFSPMNWFVLAESTIAHQPIPQRQLSNYEDGDELQPARSSSPISELGGWRESEQVDIADLRPDPPYSMPISEREGVWGTEEEGEDYEGEYDPYDINAPSTPYESQAIAIKVTPVWSRQIRQVRV